MTSYESDNDQDCAFVDNVEVNVGEEVLFYKHFDNNFRFPVIPYFDHVILNIVNCEYK